MRIHTSTWKRYWKLLVFSTFLGHLLVLQKDGWDEYQLRLSIRGNYLKSFAFSDIVHLLELQNNYRIFAILDKKGMRLYTRPGKGSEKKFKQLAQAVHASITNDLKSVNQVKIVATKNSLDTHCPTPLDSKTILCAYVIPNLTEQENIKKIGEHEKSPRPGTFAKKVKKRIAEEQEKTFLESLEKTPVNTPLMDTLIQTPEFTKNLHDLVSKKTRIKEVSIVKLNAWCSRVLPNELPPKEKDPGIFILP
ncbi:hypothetical protein Tco_0631190 [Tanacetum coccineum]